jgi:hypothetical protein
MYFSEILPTPEDNIKKNSETDVTLRSRSHSMQYAGRSLELNRIVFYALMNELFRVRNKDSADCRKKKTFFFLRSVYIKM